MFWSNCIDRWCWRSSPWKCRPWWKRREHLWHMACRRKRHRFVHHLRLVDHLNRPGFFVWRGKKIGLFNCDEGRLIKDNLTWQAPCPDLVKVQMWLSVMMPWASLQVHWETTLRFICCRRLGKRLRNYRTKKNFTVWYRNVGGN